MAKVFTKGDRCPCPWAPLQLHTWNLRGQCRYCEQWLPLPYERTEAPLAR